MDEEGWEVGDWMILYGVVSGFKRASYTAAYGHANPTHDAEVLHLFARVLWDQQAIGAVDGARIVGRW